ncbi:hypothetical protein BBJ28_00014139 [Nothophytophthora sp. Chile5]|nr:hypothetical protein BBJ28_00014139 [Nothophytophthora sp. Chile5]
MLHLLLNHKASESALRLATSAANQNLDLVARLLELLEQEASGANAARLTAQKLSLLASAFPTDNPKLFAERGEEYVLRVLRLLALPSVKLASKLKSLVALPGPLFRRIVEFARSRVRTQRLVSKCLRRACCEYGWVVSDCGCASQSVANRRKFRKFLASIKAGKKLPVELRLSFVDPYGVRWRH